MSPVKYRCRQCGAPLELFATLYSRSPIDENTGGIGEAYEENILGSNEYLEIQCSEDADHDCGFIYKDGEIVERH
jgi:hypothetical protein